MKRQLTDQFDAASSSSKSSKEIDEQKELEELYKQQEMYHQFNEAYQAFKASAENISLDDLNRSIDEFKQRAISELRQLESVNFSKRDIQTEQDRIGEQYEGKIKDLNIASFIASFFKKKSMDELKDITPDSIPEWIKTDEGVLRKLKIMEDEYRIDAKLQDLDMETKRRTIDDMLEFDRSMIDKKRKELGLGRAAEGSSTEDDTLLQRLADKYNSLQKEVVEKLDPMEENPDIERSKYFDELKRIWGAVREATREAEDEYKNIKTEDGRSKFAELHNAYLNFQIYLKTRANQYNVINIMEKRIDKMSFDEVESLLDNPEEFQKEVEQLIKVIRDKVKIKDDEFKDSYEQQLPM